MKARRQLALMVVAALVSVGLVVAACGVAADNDRATVCTDDD